MLVLNVAVEAAAPLHGAGRQSLQQRPPQRLAVAAQVDFESRS
jgi:hypothetical protein